MTLDELTSHAAAGNVSEEEPTKDALTGDAGSETGSAAPAAPASSSGDEFASALTALQSPQNAAETAQ